MNLSRLPAPPLDGRVGYPLGFVAATVVTLTTVAAGATGHPGLALATLSGVAATIAATTTFPAAFATAAVCWAMHTGFVLNRRGELLLTDQAQRAAVVLAAVTVTGYALGVAIRLASRPAIRGVHHRVVRRQTLVIPAPRSASPPHAASMGAGRVRDTER